MGFFSGLLSAAVPLVSSFIPGGQFIAPLLSGLSGGGSLGGMLSGITGGIDKLFGGASGGLSSLFSSLGDGIKKLFTGGFSTFLSSADSILGTIHTGINDVAKAESSFITPISKLVHSVTADVQALNDNVVGPIRDLINTYNNTSTTVLTSIQADIHNGLSGILKVPQDLAHAFTAVDAQFGRAVQQLGQTNRETADKVLVPGLSKGIGDPISEIVAKLASPEFQQVSGAAYLDYINLPETVNTDAIEGAMKDIIESIENGTGPFSWVTKGLFDILRVADYILAATAIALRPTHQAALATVMPELLGISEATEAARRGLISEEAWSAELAKHGLSPERRKVLYDLTQFIFGPREAIELYERGAINDSEFNTLMDQNNLDAGQAAALLEIMQERLGPNDIIVSLARGYMGDAQGADYFKAALVPESIQGVLQGLAEELVSPGKMTLMRGRQMAAEGGFLVDSLTSKPPEDISRQYKRSLTEDGTADLDWLAHWDIPSAAWWVDAYFRGLKTHTELENAFTALRIPRELWEDIIAVEEELPPVWLVPDIVKTGVWGKDQAVPTLMKLGFSEANASVLYEYGKAAGNTAAAATAADLARVSLGNARTAYDDGLITRDMYVQVLLDHGYSQDAADLTVNLAEYELQQAQLKSRGDLLVEEVKLGYLTPAQAESQLYDLGMATLQVARYMDKIESARVLNAKLPSESQVEAMYKKGIITIDDALGTLSLLGYNQTWSERIIKLWG